MNLLAVVGSPRKGKATDTLVDAAIEGATDAIRDCRVRKINLCDHTVGFCRNCLACRDSKTDEAVSKCSIRDDMDEISQHVLTSDALILGTPVHMGAATGIMTTFGERICWTFAKPQRQYLTVQGCPRPRSDKKRKAIIIVVSGVVPPVFRRFCDAATPLIKQTIADSLNAKTAGTLYAGGVEHRGIDRYRVQARHLGMRLRGCSN